MTRIPRRSGFQVTRVVVFALAVGVGVLWGVAWVLTDGGVLGVAPDIIPDDTALLLWAAVALPGFAGALYFRNRAAAVRRRSGPSDPPTTADRQQAQTSAIIAHALLEGPALLGGVIFLLIGASSVVRVALPVYLLGIMLTWPQREWFGEAAEGAASEPA